MYVWSQGCDVWQALGPWVTEAQPNLGPGVSDRFKMAAGISQEEAAAATQKRQRCGSSWAVWCAGVH